MNQFFNNNNILSRARLKDQAKTALSGKFGKFILACFIAGAITFSVQLLVEVLAILVYVIIIFVQELGINGITMDELQVILENLETTQPYATWIPLIDYFVTQIITIFTNVFTVGITLYALNLACNKTTAVSDIFYGFRNQFGKSLKLSAIFVLISQLNSLPNAILSIMTDTHADLKLIVLTIVVYVVCLFIYFPICYSVSQAYFLMLDFPHYSVGELIKLSSNIMKGHKFRLFVLELSFFPLLLLSLLSLGIGALWVAPYMKVTYVFFFLNLMQARESVKTSATESILPDSTY